jgi:G3E family GTPase
LSENGRKVVIVENEVGKIGIDGKYLRQYGLDLLEVYGGCVCCTMRFDLKTTFRKISNGIRPDWVIIEPTGVAHPAEIVKTAQREKDLFSVTKVITIIDAERYEMLMEMMMPLMNAQLDAADILAVNKIDTVPDEAVDSMLGSLQTSHPGKPVLRLCAEADKNLMALFSLI